MEALKTTLSDYERERGKPLPSFNHSYVQANMAAELGGHLQPQWRMVVEVSLELLGRKLVPGLAIFPKYPIDLQHDTA